MPRSYDRHSRPLWQGAGDAWTMVVELITATGVWAAIGFGLDRLFDTWPILFVIGAVVGHGTGIYMVYRRAATMSERERAGTTRSDG